MTDDPQLADDEQLTSEAGATALLNDGPGWVALSERTDLSNFGDSNSIALFAAELRLGVEDIEAFAMDALTDHGNDKKCDLVAVMRDRGLLVVAQSYAAKNWDTKTQGPANKASDLNTAVSWLLSGPLETLPDVLRDAAIQARDALATGEISALEIWSVHNCPEGANIERELSQAALTASSIIVNSFPNTSVNVSHYEIGRDSINDLYKRTQLPILVDAELSFHIDGGFETSGDDWRAFNTAVPLADLHKLWSKYSTDLLSPNIRDYLGVRKTERNINFGIKQSAKDQPKDFFIYNNGITAMVHSFSPSDDLKRVDIVGLGIVNGSQTTRSVGTLTDAEASKLSDAKVQIRFVTSSKPTILENVVRFNNTQNKVEATDFRSKDAVQDRLRKEFEIIPDALYRGARRGGSDDAIKRDRTLLADDAVAQALAAFHGNPNLAYNDLRQIWENDNIYARFFNEALAGRHVVFCYSLLKSVESVKKTLLAVPEANRTNLQKGHAEFFRTRGGTLLLTAAIGSSVETILSRAVPNKFDLHFKGNQSPASAIELWTPIVNVGLAFTSQLTLATNLGLKSSDKVQGALSQFESMLEATRSTMAEVFDEFSSQVGNE